MVPRLEPAFTKQLYLCRLNPKNRFQMIKLSLTEYDVMVMPFEHMLLPVQPQPRHVRHFEDLVYHQYFRAITDKKVELDKSLLEPPEDMPNADVLEDYEGFGHTARKVVVGDLFVEDSTKSMWGITDVREYPLYHVFTLGSIDQSVEGFGGA